MQSNISTQQTEAAQNVNQMSLGARHSNFTKDSRAKRKRTKKKQKSSEKQEEQQQKDMLMQPEQKPQLQKQQQQFSSNQPATSAQSGSGAEARLDFFTRHDENLMKGISEASRAVFSTFFGSWHPSGLKKLAAPLTGLK